MRQQNDLIFVNILSRLRVGVLTIDNIKILTKRQITFNGKTSAEKLSELCDYLMDLPSKTVCLL